ncbi:MAG: sulfate ABC transporter permease subunit CysW [Oscillatoriales cyanobacterium SM2_2_1]|nr:sulfate ABC transporter permease subunit CysW [Oscillatoriales cyanobacterium SM2_2_1]
MKNRRWKFELWILNFIALSYLALVLIIPMANVFYQAFKDGLEGFWATFGDESFRSATLLTLAVAAIAIPLNTIFGLCAAWVLARHKFPGKAVVLSILDLPFSISPVVAGLMIVLLYGRLGWFGSWLEANNIRVVFAFPSIAIASAFVSLPFVAREVIPVLEELGKDQEEAARTLGANSWQTFWRVILPSIKWGLLYGVILTNARAMGEFGAVSVVSGNIAGDTQTLPLFVETAYKEYQTQTAYSASVALALLAIVTLVAKTVLTSTTKGVGRGH